MTYSKVSRSRCSSSFKNQICFVVSYYLHTYICFACVVNVCFATASKKPLDPPASNSIPLPSRGFNDVLRLLRAVGTGGKPPSLQRLQKTKGYPKAIYTKYSKLWLIMLYKQLIVFAENVRSWFKSWVFPFTFRAY